jgi:hypothetical protein
MNDQEREQARDQLEAATVRTYRQMRTDQERIAELDREVADRCDHHEENDVIAAARRLVWVVEWIRKHGPAMDVSRLEANSPDYRRLKAALEQLDNPEET